jgi:hypothetical protein
MHDWPTRKRTDLPLWALLDDAVRAYDLAGRARVVM